MYIRYDVEWYVYFLLESYFIEGCPFVLTFIPKLLLLSISLLASIMTKTGVAKDEQDTDMWQGSHRDGKSLRDEIRLTTRLGWSDRYVEVIFNASSSFV